MESSNHQRFDKSTVFEMEGLYGICRLRHQLNGDCLLKIFEYLNVKDLVRLSKLDSYFYDLIATEFIGKNIIDLGLLDKKMPNHRIVIKRSTIETFELFGKFLKKIRIKGEDFSLLLKTIIKYCEPHRLTVVDLQFNSESAVPTSQLIHHSLPFFSKLCRMTLADLGGNGLYQQFLKNIAENANDLEILDLLQVDIVDGWLQKMQNLSQLHINAGRNISLDDLNSCCEVNPQLKAFAYKGNDDLSDVYHTLSVYCPGLETFSDCHLSNPYFHDNKADVSMSKRYQFLTKFKHLDNVTLTSYTESGHDLNHHLKILALANISKLCVCMSREKPIALSIEEKAKIMESVVTPLDNLKTMQIAIECVGVINCDSRCEYVFQLVSQLKNIENVKFLGRGFINVHSILRHTAKIRRLCIADIDFRSAHHEPELRKLERATRNVVIRHPMEEKCTKHLLLLNVNYQQWKCLQVLETICGKGWIRTTCIDDKKR